MTLQIPERWQQSYEFPRGLSTTKCRQIIAELGKAEAKLKESERDREALANHWRAVGQG